MFASFIGIVSKTIVCAILMLVPLLLLLYNFCVRGRRPKSWIKLLTITCHITRVTRKCVSYHVEKQILRWAWPSAQTVSYSSLYGLYKINRLCYENSKYSDQTARMYMSVWVFALQTLPKAPFYSVATRKIHKTLIHHPSSWSHSMFIKHPYMFSVNISYLIYSIKLDFELFDQYIDVVGFEISA